MSAHFKLETESRPICTRRHKYKAGAVCFKSNVLLMGTCACSWNASVAALAIRMVQPVYFVYAAAFAISLSDLMQRGYTFVWKDYFGHNQIGWMITKQLGSEPNKVDSGHWRMQSLPQAMLKPHAWILIYCSFTYTTTAAC